jgi:hypothetical protein
MTERPVRVQRKRTKGWRMPANTISVTRPGPYGNPYVVGRDGTPKQCVEKYRKDLERAIALAAMPPREAPMRFGRPIFLGPLKGKNLACFCALDDPWCHADVLLELANR